MQSAPDVLLVEDDHDLRDSLRDLLEDRGYRVVEATSGRQALSYLITTDELPALILLDLLMPDMDGNKLLNLLWSYSRLSMVPVVVLSGTSPEQLPLTRPVARRLVKPVPDEILVTTVAELSGRSPGGH